MSPYNPETIGPTVPYNTSGGADSIKDLEFVDNEVTGRTYQRRVRTTTGPDGTEVEYDVWEVLSEPKNRTFIGPEDPMSQIDVDKDNYTELRKFKAGDLWWDTSDMELRVLHSPKLGEYKNTEIFGRKAWVSSTHPTAYMLGDNVGSNKNQVLGATFLNTSGAYNEITYENDKIEFELTMPYYTGDDGSDSDVADADKRYTHSYQCIPSHNGDPVYIQQLKESADNGNAEAIRDLQKYENLIQVDNENSSIMKVSFGEIAVDPNGNGNKVTQTVYVEATTKVKTAYIDYFVANTADGVVTAPQEIGSKVIKVYPKIIIDSDIDIELRQMTLEEILAADGIVVPDNQYPDDRGPDTPQLYFKFPDEVKGNLPDEVDEDGNIVKPGDEITVFQHIRYTGLGDELDLGAGGSGWEQIPYNTTYVNLNRLGMVNLHFIYGKEGEMVTLPDASTLPVTEFRKKYRLEFYEEGYVQQISGDFLPTPDELDGIYQTPATVTNFDRVEEDGSTTIGVKLTLNYQDKPADGRFYMIVKDDSDNFIHEMKGALNVDNPTPFDQPEN